MWLVILIPVLRRPHRILPLMESIAETTFVEHRLLFIASPSDNEEIIALRNAGADFVVMDADHLHGDYARKINAGYKITTEPYLFLGADDLKFHPNWYENAMLHMTGDARVIGTNDLGNPRVLAGQHATHSLVARAYIDECGTIDEDGKVLHEGYQHEFVDDEFIGTAKCRDVFRFASNSIVEHLHPNWGKAPIDSLYAQQQKRMAASHLTYLKRVRLWT